MAATSVPAAPSESPRRRLPLWARISVWIVRLALLWLLIKVIRNPWPLLRSRIFPAALLWVAFSVYWGIAARNSAPTKTTESGKSKWFHQIVLNVAILLLLIPVPGLNGWFISERFHSSVAVGAVVQAAFALLAVWARRHLGRNWSAEVRIGEGHELVTTGPYRILRHPIYTAMLGMSVGTAIASSQYHALVGLAILLLAYIRKTGLEDRILQEAFTAEYDAYHQRTWALVPGLF